MIELSKLPHNTEGTNDVTLIVLIVSTCEEHNSAKYTLCGLSAHNGIVSDRGKCINNWQIFDYHYVGTCIYIIIIMYTSKCFDLLLD